MSNFLRVLRDLALLIARVALGGVLVLHAWRRWQVEGIEAQIAFLGAHGVPWTSYVAWAAIIGEGIGGILLIVGLLIPIVAAGVLVAQVLIICWTSWYQGPYVADRGWEYQVIIGVLALLFVVYGAGRASIDSLFRRSNRADSNAYDHSPA